MVVGHERCGHSLEQTLETNHFILIMNRCLPRTSVTLVFDATTVACGEWGSLAPHLILFFRQAKSFSQTTHNNQEGFFLDLLAKSA